ncbi:hypothetical protein [Planosporangium thailandense]|nr:hypothetical protein [Planosporangium thailandense]
MRLALPAIVACAALTGCAAGQPGTHANESGGSSVSNSAAQPGPSGARPGPSAGQPGSSPVEDLPVPAPPTGAPGGPSRPGDLGTKPSAPMTLTGTVRAGVEPNCMLLDSYLLIGGPRDQLRDGARVTVTGRVQADLVTTCQQGTPFIVESAKSA